MKFLRPGMAALLLWMIFSCNAEYTSENEKSRDIAAVAQTSVASDTIAYKETPQDPASPPGGNPPQQPGQQAAPPQRTDWDKKIIKNALLNIEVPDYKAFNQQVHTSVKQWGGYIAQEEEQTSDYKMENALTIKVPVDQFDNLVQSLSEGKEKVVVKKITSQDVTGEVVDTRSRLEAKKQVRQRYLDLLKQAKNMEEILQVQSVINDIQVEIESAAGRVNYLNHASAFSSVQLTFFQIVNANAIERREPSFGDRVLLSLKNGLLWMGEFLVLLLNLWPLALIVGILIWGAKRWRTNRKVKANS